MSIGIYRSDYSKTATEATPILFRPCISGQGLVGSYIAFYCCLVQPQCESIGYNTILRGRTSAEHLCPPPSTFTSYRLKESIETSPYKTSGSSGLAPLPLAQNEQQTYLFRDAEFRHPTREPRQARPDHPQLRRCHRCRSYTSDGSASPARP